MARGQVDEALASAEAAPQRAKVAVAEVLYLWAEGQRSATAPTDTLLLVRIYLSAGTLDPTHVAYYKALSEALPRDWLEPASGEPAGEAKKAHELWQEAARTHPDLLLDPDFRLAGGVLAKAARSYRDAADLNPEDSEVQILAAKDCLDSGDLAQASP